jgi:hypothetical protein
MKRKGILAVRVIFEPFMSLRTGVLGISIWPEGYPDNDYWLFATP